MERNTRLNFEVVELVGVVEREGAAQVQELVGRDKGALGGGSIAGDGDIDVFDGDEAVRDLIDAGRHFAHRELATSRCVIVRDVELEVGAERGVA